MFQGIVEQKGRVERLAGRVLEIVPARPWRLKAGASLAVNGVCLTVGKALKNKLLFDLGEETLRCTNLGRLRAGETVNLERPLQFGARMDGHLVLGHVDTVGIVTGKSEKHNSQILTVALDKKFSKYIVAKGSIAMEGISLTINAVKTNREKIKIQVCLIPETLKRTNLGQKKTGDPLNIETDYIAKICNCSGPSVIARSLRRSNLKNGIPL